jgi:hypothetical protein
VVARKKNSTGRTPLKAIGLMLGISYGILGYILPAESANSKGEPPIKEGPFTYNIPIVIEKDFAEVMQQDKADKPKFMERQRTLLEKRYDLQNQPSKTITMSRGKPVQEGVRVKLPEGVTWQQLSQMTPKEIKQQGVFPQGFQKSRIA